MVDDLLDGIIDTIEEKELELHIFIKKNGKKHVTFIENLYLLDDGELTNFHEYILRKMKKTFNCNGAIKENEENHKVLQLSGDQRENVRDMLLKLFVIKKEQIKIHGF